jgi:hypothetical protein
LFFRETLLLLAVWTGTLPKAIEVGVKTTGLIVGVGGTRYSSTRLLSVSAMNRSPSLSSARPGERFMGTKNPMYGPMSGDVSGGVVDGPPLEVVNGLALND